MREEKTRLWRVKNLKTGEIQTGVEQIETTSAFIEEKFNEIEKKKVEACTVGEVELNENEKKLLRMHPKFALRTNLDREQFELDIESGFTKLRWEISKEEETEEGGRKRKRSNEKDV